MGFNRLGNKRQHILFKLYGLNAFYVCVCQS